MKSSYCLIIGVLIFQAYIGDSFKLLNYKSSYSIHTVSLKLPHLHASPRDYQKLNFYISRSRHTNEGLSGYVNFSEKRNEGKPKSNIVKTLMTSIISSSVLLSVFFMATNANAANDLGANDTSNTKIRKGGASTLQQGITKSITRGVNLDGSDFHGQNMKGVAFQQSIVRDANFKDANLYSASFFEYVIKHHFFSFYCDVIIRLSSFSAVQLVTELILKMRT